MTGIALIVVGLISLYVSRRALVDYPEQSQAIFRWISGVMAIGVVCIMAGVLELSGFLVVLVLNVYNFLF